MVVLHDIYSKIKTIFILMYFNSIPYRYVPICYLFIRLIIY